MLRIPKNAVERFANVPHGAPVAMIIFLLVQSFISGPVIADEPKSIARPYGIDQRALWTTSRIVGSPEKPSPYTVRRAFAKLSFDQPLLLVTGPAGDRFYVGHRSGRVLSFANDPLTDKTDVFLESGVDVYSLAFHPQFKDHRQVFLLTNNVPSHAKDGPVLDQILRFDVSLDDPPRCIPNSRVVILEFPSNGHNGGSVRFGPDGYLYISTGDGSGDSDGNVSGQDVSDFTGSVLRIDVDDPAPGKTYAVPPDNPFRQRPGARPEIWAYGFRNPWRFSFDFETGELWLGDVGQDLWEMIYLVQRGGNYGWSVNEGSHPFYPSRQHGPTPILPPMAEHPHSEARSMTGGLVYRGQRLRDLIGTYVYADYETGKVWGLRHKDGQVTWHEELADTALKIVTFEQGPGGRLYLVAHLGGEIYELIPAPPSRQTNAFPKRLSETGLFASTKDLRPAPGVIPYSVNAILWSDHAEKDRYLALPGESRMTFEKIGTWGFPEGAVLVKSFYLRMDEGNPVSRRRLETRIMTLQGGQWAGYTYLWNDEQTDADLAPAQGVDREYTIVDSAAPGGSRRQPWHFPSRTECMVCHSRAAKFALGPSTEQMNKQHDYGEVTDNQLRTLEHLGLFTKPLPQPPDKLPRLTDPYDETADLNARARSYLHANCSHCHVKSGGGNAMMTLLHSAKLKDAGLVDVRPQHSDFGLTDAKLVAAGAPSRSVLYHRMSSRGKNSGQMPPLGSALVDHQAVKLMGEWIAQLKSPPPAGQ